MCRKNSITELTALLTYHMVQSLSISCNLGREWAVWLCQITGELWWSPGAAVVTYVLSTDHWLVVSQGTCTGICCEHKYIHKNICISFILLSIFNKVCFPKDKTRLVTGTFHRIMQSQNVEKTAKIKSNLWTKYHLAH